tara:strand:- start:118 stop:1881 length:1764 start_codon:yes stop_codon:yes gene_type:complete
MSKVNEEIISVAMFFKKDEATLNGIGVLRRQKYSFIDLLLRDYEQFKNLADQLRSLQEKYFHNFRFKKQKAELLRDIVSHLDNLKDLLIKIKKAIKDQLALLNAGLIIEENENMQLEEIQNKINNENVKEVVSLEKKFVLDLIQDERKYKEILDSQLKTVKEEIARIKAFNNDGNYSIYDIGSGLIACKPLKSSNNPEKKLTRRSRKLIHQLEKRHKRILKEYHKLESTYSKSELRKLPIQIIADIKKQYDKVRIVQDYFQKERSVRNGISPKTLIAVHLTNFLPQNGVLLPTGHAVKKKHDVYIGRETIHFTFNGPVADLGGFATLRGAVSWSHKTYAILIPVDKIWKRFVNIVPIDAFIIGDLKLPAGSELIVPHSMELFKKRRLAYYQKKAGKARVIFREPHEKVKDVVKRRIDELGYSRMRMFDHTWGADSKEATEALKILSGLKELPDGAKKDFWKLGEYAEKSVVNHFNTELEHTEKWILQYQDCLSVDGVVKRFVWMTKEMYPYVGRMDQKSFEEYKENSIATAEKIKEEVTELYTTATDKEVKEAFQRQIIFFNALIQLFENDLNIDIISEAKSRKLIK